MRITTVHQQSVCTGDEKASNCLACLGNYVAAVVDDSIVCFSESVSQFKLATLDCHKAAINFIAIGHSVAIPVLATSSSDAINVWRCLPTFLACAGKDEVQTPLQLARNFGQVQFMAFSWDDEAIAACILKDIVILNTKTRELVATLSGHRGAVTCAEFCMHDASLLVSVSEDRSYSLWNFLNQEHIYQSSILSGNSLLCVSFHPSDLLIATGSADGMLRVFDLTLRDAVHEVDLHKRLAQARCSSLESCSDSTVVRSQLAESETKFCSAVLSIKFWPRTHCHQTDDDHSLLKSALCDDMWLVVGCGSGVCVLKLSTVELLHYFDLTLSEVAYVNVAAIEPVNIGAARAYSFDQQRETCFDEMNFALAPLFSASVHKFRILSSEDGGVPSSNDVTVIPREPLLVTSPLRAEMRKKDACQPAAKGTKQSLQKKKIDKMNQPLVFNSKVKSSGYTAKPRMNMFTPARHRSEVGRTSEKNRVGPWGGSVHAIAKKPDTPQYPCSGDAPTNLQSEKQLIEPTSPINGLLFSDTGRSLACAVADGSACITKSLSLEISSTFTGHNGAVNSACMSHCGSYLLTSSKDKTVRVWLPGQADPLLRLSHLQHNFRNEKPMSSVDQKNPAFCKDISRATFYFVDKFILMNHGNTLCMYKYHFEASQDPLKRYLNNNRYKLVTSIEAEGTQLITTFAAVNSFFSYIVICACSNKSLLLLDMNRGAIVREIPEAHLRPTSTIRQNQGSSFATHADEAYDLFVTVAVTDGIKLWDMRNDTCVRKFTGHVNKAHAVGLAYSPCARYIAVGSEDRAVYIYDIRGSSYLHRLAGHSDVVSALDFHPQQALLASGTISGQIRMYRDAT